MVVRVLLLVGLLLLLGLATNYLLGGESWILTEAYGYGWKEDSEATQEAVGAVARGINQFGIDLLKEMKGNDNAFISPVSIVFALAVAAEGARGETFDEIVSTLHLPRDACVRRPAFARIYNLLNRESSVTVELANALWLRSGFEPEERYLSIIQRYYPADVYDTIDPERINAWVRRRAHGKIPKVVEQLPSETVMVITNAIYFYGEWAEKFDRKNTRKTPFYTPSGRKDVDMMYDQRDALYHEDAYVQALLLPYADGNFVMVIILPRGSVDEYLSRISAEELEKIIKSMHMEKVAMYIPRFELDTDIIELRDHLSKLGIRRAFTPAADFSNIWGRPGDIYIKDVLHRAYVRVDEEGTEAAAATGVVMVKTCAGCGQLAKVFKVDHPFLFFIVDRESGVMLFAGKIVDPPAVGK